MLLLPLLSVEVGLAEGSSDDERGST